jgi:monoamine oxidase
LLAKNIDMRLDTPVRAIRHSADGVVVETATGKSQADFAICTAPLGVLKAKAIAFDPLLPDALLASIERLGVGSVAKASIAFDQALWPAGPHWFGHVGRERGRWPIFLNVRAYSGRNILTAMSTGPHASKTEAMDRERLQNDLLDALGSMLGKKLPKSAGFIASAWSQDGYARGAYSVAAPGSTPADFDRFHAASESRLLFAGEHTDFAYHATVHGALLSGQRAAKAILPRL